MQDFGTPRKNDGNSQGEGDFSYESENLITTKDIDAAFNIRKSRKIMNRKFKDDENFVSHNFGSKKFNENKSVSESRSDRIE